MKNIFSFVALCASLFLANQAQAATVYSSHDLGYVSSSVTNAVLPVGSASIGAGETSVKIDNSYTGTLAAYSTIRIDFSVTEGTLGLWSRTLEGSVDYKGDLRDYSAGTGLYYEGGSQADLTKSMGNQGVSAYNAWGGTKNLADNWTSVALAVATAGFIDNQHAYITITNNSPLISTFLARLNTDLGALALSTFNVTYTVSSVPLPAALPLFGLGLVALAGYRGRYKKAV